MATKKTVQYQILKAELDELLDKLQREDCDVDEALKGYEHGRELIKQLENYLTSAENKIQQLQSDQD